MSNQVPTIYVQYGTSISGLSFRRFESNGNGGATLNRNISSNTINCFQNLLGLIVTAAREGQNVVTAFRILLVRAFQIMSYQLGNNIGGFSENLVVLIVDGTLPLGDDHAAVSNELSQYGITLAIVADRMLAPEVQDYYRTLARCAGGEFMFLTGARVTLAHVISSAIYGEDTLRQAFRSLYTANIPSMINHTNEQVGATDSNGDFLFDHGLSQ